VSAGDGAPALQANGTGWYLYGVIAAEQAVHPGHGVSVVSEGAVAGVTSRVSLEEFDEATLPQKLADTPWLEQKIRAHEQVLESVLETAPVIPCRFCTIYRSEDDLRLFLAERSDALTQALERVAGRVELGVKAFVDQERFASGGALRNDAIREHAERASQAAGGRAYLEQRRLEQLVAEELARFKGEVADELHERLLAAADDGVRLALQRPELTGRDEEMLFNGAYLVRDQARFEQELSGLAEEQRESGVELELTGPWPPYNFVPAELAES
jgi:hypothetical protein